MHNPYNLNKNAGKINDARVSTECVNVESKENRNDNHKNKCLKKISINSNKLASLKFKIKLNSYTEDNVAFYKIESINDNTSKKQIEEKQVQTPKKFEMNEMPQGLSVGTCDKSQKAIRERANNIDPKRINLNTAAVPSPDLFDDDTISYEFEVTDNKERTLAARRHVVKQNESETLSNIKKLLSNEQSTAEVLAQGELSNLIIANKDKILNFCKTGKQDGRFGNTTLSFENVVKTWPEILTLNYFGLCYNLSKISEEIELLNLSIVERFVKSETSSSFRLSPSSVKKKVFSITQSPRSRLSHLARRRAMFSSANLQIASQKTTNAMNKKQILLNSIKGHTKLKNKAPIPKTTILTNKRNSNGRSPSSVKKSKLLMDNKIKGSTIETSKRALFQSPPQSIISSIQMPKPLIKPEIAIRIEKSKRALFSAEKQNQAEESLKAKRSLDDEINNITTNKIKLCDTFSVQVSDNALIKSIKSKSQSFCASDRTVHCEYSPSAVNSTLVRSSSDTPCSSQLSESHKKKLLWAVSQALLKKKIGTSHPDFKKHVCVLAKVIKRLFLEFYNKSNSASETLLKLSKKYVYSVLNGSTADEIYLIEKLNFEKEKKSTETSFSRYTTSVEFSYKSPNIKNSLCVSSNVIKGSNYHSITHSSCNNVCAKYEENRSKIYSNSSKQFKKNLQNNSSKKNVNIFDLKENTYCIQRKSGQKVFTGRDERNISPCLENSNNLNMSSVVNGSINLIKDRNIFNAKRQISFDE